jgi:23S rRNA (pseudouridine1915-N3)-methyltransferase
MKIEFWSIGKQHDPAIKSAIEDYTKRINKYCSVKWEILPVPKNAGMLSEIDLKRLEGKMVMEWASKDDILIALDENAKEMDSIGLSEFIIKQGNMGIKKMIFLIGGAFGLDESILKRANYTWSLSKLTFPHQLVRLILAEQVYRAYTIIKNEKYHHR